MNIISLVTGIFQPPVPRAKKIPLDKNDPLFRAGQAACGRKGPLYTYVHGVAAKKDFSRADIKYLERFIDEYRYVTGKHPNKLYTQGCLSTIHKN